MPTRLPGPLALVAVSRAGAALTSKLAQAWPSAECYVLARHADPLDSACQAVEPPLGPLIADLFARSRGLVLFLPVGAAVRLVAPHLVDKLRDPAVVAVDDEGRFAISLLAGHSGGANQLAAEVGAVLGAQPVVTTAAEARGLPVPELLGLAYGWRLEASRSALLHAAAALVNGEPLAVYQDAGESEWLPADLPVDRFDDIEALVAERSLATLIVSDRRLPDELSARAVVWRPRWLVAGLGCSSGASLAELEGLLQEGLAAGELSASGLGSLATLDRKLTEPGLRELAARLDLPLRGFTAAELACIPVPTPSNVVLQAVGTPSVAEASALAATGGRLLVTKHRSANATVAIATRTEP